MVEQGIRLGAQRNTGINQLFRLWVQTSHAHTYILDIDVALDPMPVIVISADFNSRLLHVLKQHTTKSLLVTLYQFSKNFKPETKSGVSWL